MLGTVFDAVLLNGTLGAGKSTAAVALSDRLGADGVRHAVIDTDWIRMLRPAPADDPFQHRVAVANLRDMARNFRAAGAERLIVAGVVETAADLSDIRSALVPWSVRAVLLTVQPGSAASRLRARHDDADELRWHLDRSPALAGILSSAAVADETVDTTGIDATTTARAVMRSLGW